jgi:hypothetical protein
MNTHSGISIKVVNENAVKLSATKALKNNTKSSKTATDKVIRL